MIFKTDPVSSDECRKYWKRYERGRDYIYKKDLITETNRNWNFFIGNQWENIQSGNEELPFLNFIKPTIKYKVSTVSQNNMVANFSDIEGREEMQPVYEKLNTMFSASWEKANMDLELWKTIKDSAVTGDGIQYYGTSDVSDVQRIPNTNIFYGDENEPDIQKQPYIILWTRQSIRAVKDEARLNGLTDEEVDLIVPDDETVDVVGNKDEVEGKSKASDKVTTVTHFERKDGIVYVTKLTKNVIYAPERAIAITNADGSMGRGMTLYPFAKISWEDEPNNARGVSEVKGLIPNQLEINKTLARRSMIIKMTAYPRIAYDSNFVANPEDLEKVGAPIELTTGGVQSVNQAISYMSPASSSSEPKTFADDLLENTQELSGAGETAMGNINLNRVAASAVLAVRDQAALPLNEQVAKMKTFVEDLAKLWVEIWAVYNPEGFSVVLEQYDETTGQTFKIPARITKEELDEMKPKIRIDTSQDNPWTKEAEQNWLDGVLDKQYITFEEYIDACPPNGIVPKSKMQRIVDKRRAQQQAQQEAQQQLAQQQQTEANDISAMQNQMISQWEAQDDNSNKSVQ